MYDAYKDYVRFYRERMGKTVEEALAAAAEPASDQHRDMTLSRPPDEASWLTMNALAERDPTLAQEVWERMKEMARDELASGNRAARVMEGYDHTPWDRARFLMLRESLAKEWRPANGIERMLVDMLAQAFTAYEKEMGRVMTYITMEASLNDHQIQKNNKYETPRLTSAETLLRVEQAMERYQRMILRTQRALRDQRRYGLNVGNVGQLNIGAFQQNVTHPEPAGKLGEEIRVLDGEATEHA